MSWLSFCCCDICMLYIPCRLSCATWLISWVTHCFLQKLFHDKTPYTIMFGPDKCGEDKKVIIHRFFLERSGNSFTPWHANWPPTNEHDFQYLSGNFKHFNQVFLGQKGPILYHDCRAQNNGWSLDNVRSRWQFVWAKFRFGGHFDRPRTRLSNK